MGPAYLYDLTRLMRTPPQDSHCPVCKTFVPLPASKNAAFGRWFCHGCGAKLAAVHSEVAIRDFFAVFPAMAIAWPVRPLGGSSTLVWVVLVGTYIFLVVSVRFYYKTMHDPKKWVLIKRGTEKSQKAARTYYAEVCAGIRTTKDPFDPRSTPRYLSYPVAAAITVGALYLLYDVIRHLASGVARAQGKYLTYADDPTNFILIVVVKAAFILFSVALVRFLIPKK